MTEKTKNSYFVSSGYSVIGDQRLEPGERLLVDEDNDSHKFLLGRVEAEDPEYAHLSVAEVDHKAEAKADEERKEQLAKAEKIAAKAREEELQAVQEEQDKQAEAREGQPSATEETDFPPQDEEAIALGEKSGAGQRASTQEDVVDEGGSGRRRSSKK